MLFDELFVAEPMSHTLSIEVPDNVYEPLRRTASRSGQSPEALVTQSVSLLVQQLSDEPLEQFIGSLNSQGSDWADHHDQHLGKAIASTMQTSMLRNVSDD
jgi:hypothetical protein